MTALIYSQWKIFSPFGFRATHEWFQLIQSNICKIWLLLTERKQYLQSFKHGNKLFKSHKVDFIRLTAKLFIIAKNMSNKSCRSRQNASLMFYHSVSCDERFSNKQIRKSLQTELLSIYYKMPDVNSNIDETILIQW